MDFGPDLRLFAGCYYDKTQLDVLDKLVGEETILFISRPSPSMVILRIGQRRRKRRRGECWLWISGVRARLN